MYTYICGSGCSREWEVDVNSYDHKMWFSQVVLESTTRCCFFSLFMTRCSGKWIHDDLLKNYNVSFTLLYIILPYTYFSVRHFAIWFILIQSVTFVKILIRMNVRIYSYQQNYTNEYPNIFILFFLTRTNVWISIRIENCTNIRIYSNIRLGFTL